MNRAGTFSPMSRSLGTAPLITGIAGLAVGAGLAYWGGSLMISPDGAAAVAGSQLSQSLIAVLAGAVIGIGTPLVAITWYLRRRLEIAHVPHHLQAMWVGLAWGTIAMLIAGVINPFTALLPIHGIYPGFTEEFLKLLLPVILLLTSRTYRSPRLGVWLVFVTAAWFAFLEGISDIVLVLDPVLTGGDAPPDAAFIMMMDVVVRTIAALSHPLMTVGAAVIIWISARTVTKSRAAGLGVLAYLGAAVIHGLNDAVLAGPVRDWNVPASIALTALYVVAIFLLWFRPALIRLQQSNAAESPPRAAATTSTD